MPNCVLEPGYVSPGEAFWLPTVSAGASLLFGFTQVGNASRIVLALMFAGIAIACSIANIRRHLQRRRGITCGHLPCEHPHGRDAYWFIPGKRRGPNRVRLLVYAAATEMAAAGLVVMYTAGAGLPLLALLHTAVWIWRGTDVGLPFGGWSALGIAFVAWHTAPFLAAIFGAFHGVLGQSRVAYLARFDERGFFLVLRSFRSRVLRDAPPVPVNPNRATSSYRTKGSALEPLELALSCFGGILLLGHAEHPMPLTSTRAWELRAPDDLWRGWVVHAARRSRAVILFPETSPGLMEEIVMLRERGLLGRVIFFMSPFFVARHMRRIPEVRRARAARRKRWEEVAAALLDTGVSVPPHDMRGGFFTLTPEMQVHRFLPLPDRATEASSIASVLEQLIEPREREDGQFNRWVTAASVVPLPAAPGES